jgi:hypothetical protein
MMDRQPPIEGGNAVYDGDSFNDSECEAWIKTISSYPIIHLYSNNMTNLKAKIKYFNRKYSVNLRYEEKKFNTLKVWHDN